MTSLKPRMLPIRTILIGLLLFGASPMLAGCENLKDLEGFGGDPKARTGELHIFIYDPRNLGPFSTGVTPGTGS